MRPTTSLCPLDLNRTDTVDDIARWLVINRACTPADMVAAVCIYCRSVLCSIVVCIAATAVTLSAVVPAQTELDGNVTSQTGDRVTTSSTSSGDVIAAVRHVNRSDGVMTTQRPMNDVDDADDEAGADNAGEGDEDGWPTEQRLMHALLGRYETAVRPVHNASDAVVVRMGLTLTQIFNMVSRLSQQIYSNYYTF